jgi:hypothetical protein
MPYGRMYCTLPNECASEAVFLAAVGPRAQPLRLPDLHGEPRTASEVSYRAGIWAFAITELPFRTLAGAHCFEPTGSTKESAAEPTLAVDTVHTIRECTVYAPSVWPQHRRRHHHRHHHHHHHCSCVHSSSARNAILLAGADGGFRMPRDACGCPPECLDLRPRRRDGSPPAAVEHTHAAGGAARESCRSVGHGSPRRLACICSRAGSAAAVAEKDCCSAAVRHGKVEEEPLLPSTTTPRVLLLSFLCELFSSRDTPGRRATTRRKDS